MKGTGPIWRVEARHGSLVAVVGVGDQPDMVTLKIQSPVTFPWEAVMSRSMLLGLVTALNAAAAPFTEEVRS